MVENHDIDVLDVAAASRALGVGHRARVGFVHLPLSPAMVAAAGAELPSMDVPLALRGLETVLRVVAAA